MSSQWPRRRQRGQRTTHFLSLRNALKAEVGFYSIPVIAPQLQHPSYSSQGSPWVQSPPSEMRQSSEGQETEHSFLLCPEKMSPIKILKELEINYSPLFLIKIKSNHGKSNKLNPPEETVIRRGGSGLSEQFCSA